MLQGTVGIPFAGVQASATTAGTVRVALQGARMAVVRATGFPVAVKFGSSTITADSGTVDGTGYDAKLFEDLDYGLQVPSGATHIALDGVGGTATVDIILVA